MKYLILIYDEAVRRPRPDCPDLRNDRARAHLALTDDLAAGGEMIAAEALAHPSQARRVLVCEGGGVATIDGSFADSREQLAGFYLVECEDVDRAVEHAARLPEAADGLVEVRPVLCRSGLEM